MGVNRAQRSFRATKLLCMILLGWPKISSDFSITAYGKNLNKLIGQPNISLIEVKEGQIWKPSAGERGIHKQGFRYLSFRNDIKGE